MSVTTSLSDHQRHSCNRHEARQEAEARRICARLRQTRRRRHRQGRRGRRSRRRGRGERVVELQREDVILAQRERRLAVTGLESNALRGLEDAALGLVPDDTIGSRKFTLGAVTSVPRGNVPG